jgi:putative transposase
MAAWLAREGEEVNRKRVKRLMGLMGLEAIHPGPRTTVRNPDHKVYPGRFPKSGEELRVSIA